MIFRILVFAIPLYPTWILAVEGTACTTACPSMFMKFQCLLEKAPGGEGIGLLLSGPLRWLNHPQEKEMKKAKWLSEEALKIAEQRSKKAKEKRKDISI